MPEEKIRTRDGVLIDNVYVSPVDQSQQRFRGRLLVFALLAIALLLIGFFYYFMSDRTKYYRDITEHFKYGSIGSEPGGTIFTQVGGVLPPYLVFKTLPELCPDKLPGGYASLGLVFEPGHDLPIGVSRRFRLGVEQVGLNCAVCHTGTVRESANAPVRIILGMPAHQFDLERFFRFVADASLDDRVTAASVIAKAEEMGNHVGPIQRTNSAFLPYAAAKAGNRIAAEPDWAAPQRPASGLGAWTS